MGVEMPVIAISHVESHQSTTPRKVRMESTFVHSINSVARMFVVNDVQVSRPCRLVWPRQHFWFRIETAPRRVKQQSGLMIQGFKN